MMAHEHSHLRVSKEEAMRLEKDTVARLLKHKKLSLILDLDQTVIHATVDAQVASYLNEEMKQKYPALRVNLNIYKNNFKNISYFKCISYRIFIL